MVGCTVSGGLADIMVGHWDRGLVVHKAIARHMALITEDW